jgi:hypothetical protein
MRTLLALALMLGFTGLVSAQEKKADEKKPEEKKADTKKGDPTGTWKWETEFNGQKRTSTLTLKLDGDKLTGEMPGRQGAATKIEEGTFKDGEISFTVTRTMGDNKFVTKYTGKVDGDTLKMTAESERNGEKTKREIEAKREKAEEKKDK